MASPDASIPARIVVVSTSRPVSLHVKEGGKAWELHRASGSVVDSINSLSSVLATMWATKGSFSIPAGAEAPTATPQISGKQAETPPSTPIETLWVGPIPGAQSLPPAMLAAFKQSCWDDHKVIPVQLSRIQGHALWEGYGVTQLWATMHSLPLSEGQETFVPSATKDINDRGFMDFYSASTAIADQLVPVVQRGDIVIFHDYSTMLVPQLLRSKISEAVATECSFVFLLSSPWPSFESFRCLPERDVLLSSVLQCDLVCLQDFRYVKRLCEACTQILATDTNFHRIIYNYSAGTTQARSRRVKLLIAPLGIDLARFYATIEETRASYNELLNTAFQPETPSLPARRVILSVDRLDVAKGSVHKLLAYENLLEKHREWRSKVQYVLVVRDPFSYAADPETGTADKTCSLVTSRISKQQLDLLREIHEVVGRINGVYSTFGWIPVILLRKPLPTTTIQALMARADIAFMSSLREGITIPAFELVAMKHAARRMGVSVPPGALVYSEASGAVNALQGCYVVNPLDVDGVAEQLNIILRASPKMLDIKMWFLEQSIKKYNSTHCAIAIAKRLASIRGWGFGESKDYHRQAPGLLDVPAILSKYTACKNSGSDNIIIIDLRLLCPSQSDSELLAKIPGPAHGSLHLHPDIPSVLSALASQTNTNVWVISDASLGVMKEAFASMHPNIGLVADNGYYQRVPAIRSPAAEKAVTEVEPGSNWLQMYFDPVIGDEGSLALDAVPIDIASWHAGVLHTLQYFADRTPGSFITKGPAELQWCWALSDPDFGFRQARDLQVHLESLLFSLPVEIHMNVALHRVTIRHIGVSVASFCARLFGDRVAKHANGGDTAPRGTICFLQPSPGNHECWRVLQHIHGYDVFNIGVELEDNSSVSSDAWLVDHVLPNRAAVLTLLHLFAAVDGGDSTTPEASGHTTARPAVLVS